MFFCCHVTPLCHATLQECKVTERDNCRAGDHIVVLCNQKCREIALIQFSGYDNVSGWPALPHMGTRRPLTGLVFNPEGCPLTLLTGCNRWRSQFSRRQSDHEQVVLVYMLTNSGSTHLNRPDQAFPQLVHSRIRDGYKSDVSTIIFRNRVSSRI